MSKRKYELNERYFDTIGPEQAYFAGWLMADGCNFQRKRCKNYIEKTLQIGIATSDHKILDLFIDRIDYTGTYRNFEHLRKSGYLQHMSQLHICSSTLCDSLEQNWNICPQKTGKESVPDCIRNDSTLFYHWFRGLFDGDGSVYVPKSNKKLEICIASACRPFLEDVRNIINLQGSITQGKNTRCLMLRYGGVFSLALKDRMYLNKGDLFFERKYNKFDIYRPELLKQHTWLPDELESLIKLRRNKYTVKQISIILNRSVNSIKAKLYNIGLVGELI